MDEKEIVLSTILLFVQRNVVNDLNQKRERFLLNELRKLRKDKSIDDEQKEKKEYNLAQLIATENSHAADLENQFQKLLKMLVKAGEEELISNAAQLAELIEIRMEDD